MPGSIGETFVTLLDWALRWWFSGQDPGLTLVSAVVAPLRPVAAWLSAAVLALSLSVSAVLVMFRRQGSDVAAVVLGIGRFLLAMSAGWLILAAGWTASDAIGRWILGGRPDVNSYVAAVAEALADAEASVAAMLALAGTASVMAFLTIVLARVVAAVFLAVGLPLAAAGSVHVNGAALRIGAAWFVAVISFRPCVSALYRVSHALVMGVSEPLVVLLVVPMTFVVGCALLPGVARLVAGVR